MAAAIALLVATIVAIVSMPAAFANRRMRVILKVIACVNKRLYRHLRVMGRKQLAKYAPVLTQDVIDVADVVGGIAMKLVVVYISAVVAAKLFIASAIDGLCAFGASFLYHGSGYLNK